MKKLLLLQLRPEDAASDNEYEAFKKFGGLDDAYIHRVRMESESISGLKLDEYSAVLVGGGPSNVSDSIDKKKDYELRFERELESLLATVFENDIPYLGACYGLGAIAKQQGCTVSKHRYAEDVGAVTISLTEDGQTDPLLSGLPQEFRAFVGHKEACQEVPHGSTLLASSETCPVQMIRYKKNMYACQFHPELDTEGLAVRIETYKHAGYFPPESANELIKRARSEDVHIPTEILRRFIEKYCI